MIVDFLQEAFFGFSMIGDFFLQDDLPDWWERICNGAVCYCNNRFHFPKISKTIDKILGTAAMGSPVKELHLVCFAFKYS